MRGKRGKKAEMDFWKSGSSILCFEQGKLLSHIRDIKIFFGQPISMFDHCPSEEIFPSVSLYLLNISLQLGSTDQQCKDLSKGPNTQSKVLKVS